MWKGNTRRTDKQFYSLAKKRNGDIIMIQSIEKEK